MMSFLLLLFIYEFIVLNDCKIWNADEIKNPLINPKFCQVNFKEPSLICDPENELSTLLKKTLSKYLLHGFPVSTPCFCDEGCDAFDYKRRLMAGIVIVSSINEKSMNYSEDSDIYESFSERILHNWNISQCLGNNVLILVTKKQTQIYFGTAVRKRISNSCLKRLKSLIRQNIPLSYNLRTIFKNIIEYIRKPCMCNDSCTYRHLKWLTNVVFFMGVIVLVTCIGGMSRRALVAKFHDRSFPRSNLISNAFSRPRFSGRSNVTNHVSSDTPQISGIHNPPDYSSLGPFTKPPPYNSSPNISVPKTQEYSSINQMPCDQIQESPPAYTPIFRDESNNIVNCPALRDQNISPANCDNNPAYQS